MRNVISGNSAQGVSITGSGTTNNQVAGNYIGTDASGTLPLGNGTFGVDIGAGAQANFVGTNGNGVNDAAEGNVISANFIGVFIQDAGTTNNVVAGNRIGTDSSGTASVGNTRFGVEVNSSASSTRIGTNADGVSDAFERNIISGNTGAGVV